VLELYDLAHDRDQLVNLVGTGLAVERELTPILDAFKTHGRRAVDDGMSAEQEKILRERGYWTADE
jgi:hypothetical protein